ncbi:MAG TPA: response regulator, partial [Cyanophyceae cyanobacterium]
MEEIIKILLVEDDEVDRMAVNRALKTAGVAVEIVVAVDCQRAMEAILASRHSSFGDSSSLVSQRTTLPNIGNTREPLLGREQPQSDLNEQNFDCVLLDYRLPDGDGLALVQQIRSSGILIPLIVLTGQGDEELAVELMKSGASDYLSKSKLSAQTLSRSLVNAVRIYRAEREVALATQRLRESEERYRLVVEGSNDGIWDWDIDTHEIYCNDRLYEITGLSSAQVKPTYNLFCQLLHPDDRLRV